MEKSYIIKRSGYVFASKRNAHLFVLLTKGSQTA